MKEPMNLIRSTRVHHTYHTGCLITNMFSLPFTSTRVHPRFCCRVRVAYLFNVLCYFFLVLLVFVLCPVANVASVSGLSIHDCSIVFFLTTVYQWIAMSSVISSFISILCKNKSRLINNGKNILRILLSIILYIFRMNLD
jgi:hypothetical protein